MKKWDEKEKNTSYFPITDLSDSMTEKERNIEKFMKWQMDNHISGTYYSDEYLEQVKKIMKSKTGKYGERQ